MIRGTAYIGEKHIPALYVIPAVPVLMRDHWDDALMTVRNTTPHMCLHVRLRLRHVNPA